MPSIHTRLALLYLSYKSRHNVHARNNQRYKEGLDQNVEALRQTAKNQQFANRQYNQEFEQLSKFSQTLNEYFTEEANKRNQREMEEGIAAAYTDGISPEQETALERAEAAT